MTEFTTNYGMYKPDFNLSGWHGLVNNNFDVMDALLFLVSGLSNFVGTWTNSTVYSVQHRVLDPDDSTIWNCLVAHTSAATNSFVDDRTANPTYWTPVSNTPVVRGQWTNDTNYVVGDIVYDVFEHLYGMANQVHTSLGAPNTMRDDISKWNIVADLDGISAIVSSVNGQIGVVTLDSDDIDDTGKIHKFASAAQLSNIATNTADIAVHESRLDQAETDIDVLQAMPGGGLSQEEGNWTPTFSAGGSIVGVTYGTRVGKYIKIGNVVYAWCNIELTNNGTGTGAAVISGLPYVSSNISGLYFACAIDTDDLNDAPYSNVAFSARIAANTSIITLRVMDTDDGTSTNMNESTVPDTGKIRISATYRTG